jgi:hypothetical protein
VRSKRGKRPERVVKSRLRRRKWELMGRKWELMGRNGEQSGPFYVKSRANQCPFPAFFTDAIKTEKTL